MALYLVAKFGDFRQGVWKMEESMDELLSSLPDKSFYEKQLQRFSANTRKKEWLAVRVLLSVLCEEEKKIAYTSIGKPYLEDGSFRISISHTRGYVAVALHPTKEVGIDIEQHGEKVLKVRHKFLVPEEDAIICKEDEVNHLLLHWSAKETVYKMVGMEDTELKEHIRISPFLPHSQGTFTAQEYRTELQRVYTIHYLVQPDFVLTYSVEDYFPDNQENRLFF